MDGPTLQMQARALGDPTRHEIFHYVRRSNRSVTVAEMTKHFGLNHNAVRQHLAKLLEAQLLVETTERGRGPGRPRLLYTIEPRAESRWGAVGPYERLSLMLTEVVRTGRSPRQVGRHVGRESFRKESGGADAVTALTEVMTRHGFDPSTKRTKNRIEVTLQACPFSSTALADPETVCSLHLGIAEGLAEAAGGIVIDELIRRDPREGSCKLRCHEVTPVGHPLERLKGRQ